MKKKEKNTRDIIQTAVAHTILYLLALLAGYAGLLFYTGYKNAETHEVYLNYKVDKETPNEVFVEVVKGTENSQAWMSDGMYGCQYEFFIRNNLDHAITDWSITTTVPKRSDFNDSWAGVWTLEDGVLNVTPVDYNLTIPAGAWDKAGIILYTPEDININEVSYTYKTGIVYVNTVLFRVLTILFIAGILILIVIIGLAIHINRFEREHNSYKTVVNQALKTIANIIDAKDEYTKGHSLRVAVYSKMLAEKMGMSEYDQERMYYIGLVHDIGKVGIPSSILSKPGRLTSDEFEIIKRHPEIGADYISDFTSIIGVENGVRYHHEKYDGSGYNEGLAGEAIPIEGRIIGVADSYDAMSSRRCYRDALSYDYIVNELKNNSGTQFDPKIATYMLELIAGGYAPVSDSELADFEI